MKFLLYLFCNFCLQNCVPYSGNLFCSDDLDCFPCEGMVCDDGMCSDDDDVQEPMLNETGNENQNENANENANENENETDN